MNNTYAIMGSSGELERYPDPYKEITPEVVERSNALQERISEGRQRIELEFMKLARDLSDFENEKLYLAQGYASFKSWADGEVGITYRTAHDLIRIVRELLPVAQSRGLTEEAATLGVSKLRQLLPVLSDKDGEEKVASLIGDIGALPVREAGDHIREARGLSKPLEEGTRPLFKAKVQTGETFHRVSVSFSDGVDYYQAGTLNIKPEHWTQVWEPRFGRAVEYELTR